MSGCVAMHAVMIEVVEDDLGERSERCDHQWGGQCNRIDRVQ